MSNVESNYKDKSGFEPVFVPQGAQMTSTTAISDFESRNEENTEPEASSSPLGHVKHQQYQQSVKGGVGIGPLSKIASRSLKA